MTPPEASPTRGSGAAVSVGERSVALVCWYDYYLHRYLLALIATLSEQGHEVFAVAAPGEYVGELEAAGATFVPWRVTSRSINPVGELRSVLDLRRIYKQLRPSLAHHFTVKSNIYGAFAARMAGVPATVATVTGLGYTLTNPTVKARTIGRWVRPLYKLSYRMTDIVTFQNRDDRKTIAGDSAASKAVHIPGGSGVDLEYWDPDAPKDGDIDRLRHELDVNEGDRVVALVGRMLWEKGVDEYRQAAEQLSRLAPRTKFILVGATRDGVSGYIPSAQLRGWAGGGSFSYLGERQDVREILALADVVVLPSYSEGTPRVLLEASAMARPMVTSDAPGCRDVVEHGVTGLLVPARDADALAEAILSLLNDAELRARYGAAARRRAEAEFDQRGVVRSYLSIYERLWGATAA